MRRFIKTYWAAFFGVLLIVVLEGGNAAGSLVYRKEEFQRGANIFLLMISFLNILAAWRKRDSREIRAATLLQLCFVVCEAFVINVDVFSNKIGKWEDLIAYGWNLTWVICGVFQALLVSGFFETFFSVCIQIIKYLLHKVRELAEWLEQAVRQINKSIAFEILLGTFICPRFINYVVPSRQAEQVFLWVIGFWGAWLIACNFFRLLVVVRKRFSIEAGSIPISNIFSIIREGMVLIGTAVMAFLLLSAQNSASVTILLLLILILLFVWKLKKTLKEGIFHKFWEESGIASDDLSTFILGCLLVVWLFFGLGIAEKNGTVQVKDLTELLELFKVGLDVFKEII